MKKIEKFVTFFKDFDIPVQRKVLSSICVLFPLKINTLCIKLGSNYDHFLFAEPLVSLVFCTNNGCDLQPLQFIGRILIMAVLVTLNLPYSHIWS